MRIQQVLAFLGAAVLSFSAHGQSAESESANTVKVQGGKSVLYRLSNTDAQYMKGGFSLEDGRQLHITNRAFKLYAELDGKREELIPVGATAFIGRDSGNRISFDRVPFAEEVVVDQILVDGSRVSMAGR